MLKKHYDRITLQTVLYFVSGIQKIKIMKYKYPSEPATEILLAGTYSRENRAAFSKYEYSEVMDIQARGDVLVIEVKGF